MPKIYNIYIKKEKEYKLQYSIFISNFYVELKKNKLYINEIFTVRVIIYSSNKYYYTVSD